MNAKNLVPNEARTPEERRKNATKAGIASGKARQEKKRICEALQKALGGTYDVDGKKMDGYSAIAVAVMKQALEGDVKAFKEIRDTIGEKPKEMLEVKSNDLSAIKIKFVDKSERAKGKEKDPKIVGEYTPPSNVEE